MKVSNDDIRTLIYEAKDEGHSVGLRDVAYALLSRSMDEPTQAFRVIFGERGDLCDRPFADYRLSDKVKFVADYLSVHFPEEEKVTIELPEEEMRKDDSMSFDEIKAGLEEDLKSLIALRDQTDEFGKSVLDAKEMATVVGRIADIRTKLVERFGSSEKKEEQRVIVIQKYTDICPHCGHEVAIDPRHEKLF